MTIELLVFGRLCSLLGCSLLLTACQTASSSYTAKTPAADESQAKTTSSTASKDDSWEWQNFTPFPAFVSSFEKGDKPYLALSSKVTLTWENDDSPVLELAANQTPMQTNAKEEALSTSCEAYGASMNDRTTDFPYTGLLINGGKLAQVSSPRTREATTLRSLTFYKQSNELMYVGKDRLATEYAYAACIGNKSSFDSAHRLDRYLPQNAILHVDLPGKKKLRLSLNEQFAPYLLLRYRSGEMIPVPSRIVFATVDVSSRTLILHYRSMFDEVVPLRKVEYRAVMPVAFGGAPASDESLARFQERSRATLSDLAQCAAPAYGQYREACATPNRQPNPVIFFPSK